LRAAFTWAERLDLVAKNPAAKVTRPRVARASISPPAPRDIVRMITEASPDLALFLRLAALTGARRGQLCALHWSDVRLDAATIRWTRSLAKVPGGTVEKETKTGVDIETIAARGGWANTTTPLEVYSHFRPARDADLAERLAKRLDGDDGDGEAAGDDANSDAADQPG
jgi:integrase